MVKVLVLFVVISVCAGCTALSTPLSAGDNFNVVELTIEQTHEALRLNKISCENLTRRYLNRIKIYDQSPCFY